MSDKCFHSWSWIIPRSCLLVLLIFTRTTEVYTSCHDGSMCSFMASQGECELDPENMLLTCPRACRNPCLCNVSAFTNDTACDCLVKAKVGYCNTSMATQDCQTTCAKVTHESCPPLPLPADPNALLSTWSTHYLITVKEVCNAGYMPLISTNEGRKTCSTGGQWAEDTTYGDPVECTPIDCGNPPSSLNTFSVCKTTTYGSTAVYTCAHGYTRDHGQLTLTCNASSLWEGQLLTCKKIDCGQPPSPSNAAWTVTSTSLGGKATYKCAAGYQYVQGDMSLTCQGLGHWQGNLIVCSVIDCRSPPSFPNTQVQISGTTYSQSANYSCMAGFEQGHFTLVCGSSGNWTGNSAKCKIVDCEEPPSDEGLSVQVIDTTFGQTANYSCVPGYIFSSGDTNLTCDLSGNWSGQLMKCSVSSPQKTPVTPDDALDIILAWAVGVAVFTVVTIIVIIFVVLNLGTSRKQKKLETTFSKPNTRLASESQTVKPDMFSVQSHVSIQVMDSFNNVTTPADIKSDYLAISSSYLSPVSAMSSSTSMLSLPKSLSSVTISSLSQSTTPGCLPEVAT